MDCSTRGFPVHHQLLEFTQTHIHQVSDAIQPSHCLLSPSPPTFNLSQHQGLFIFFFNFYFYFILLYNTVLVLYTHHGCTSVPNPEPPSHLPPYTISLGHPSAPAPSILYPASNIDWRFISYMLVYMFQCHSPKSSHPLPLPLPQSPKVRSIHLSLFCCLAYRVIITIFINSIYMC